jgi:hypothetical protein
MTGGGANWLKWMAVLGLALGVLVAAVLSVNHRRVGRVLDSYRGVPVYDNGLLFFRSYGRHYSPTCSRTSLASPASASHLWPATAAGSSPRRASRLGGCVWRQFQTRRSAGQR